MNHLTSPSRVLLHNEGGANFTTLFPWSSLSSLFGEVHVASELGSVALARARHAHVHQPAHAFAVRLPTHAPAAEQGPERGAEKGRERSAASGGAASAPAQSPAKKKKSTAAVSSRALKVFGDPSWVGYAVKKSYAPAIYEYEDEYFKKMEQIKKSRENHELATAHELHQIVLRQTEEKQHLQAVQQQRLLAMRAAELQASQAAAMQGQHIPRRQRLCMHGLVRFSCSFCAEDDKRRFCQHDKIKSYCVECGLSSQCEHRRVREGCEKCKKAAICEHMKIRPLCDVCIEDVCTEHKITFTECVDCCRCMHGHHIKARSTRSWSSCKNCNILLSAAFRRAYASVKKDTAAGDR